MLRSNFVSPGVTVTIQKGSVSTLAQRFEDSAFIRDGFVSIVAEMVKK